MVKLTRLRRDTQEVLRLEFFACGRLWVSYYIAQHQAGIAQYFPILDVKRQQ